MVQWLPWLLFDLNTLKHVEVKIQGWYIVFHILRLKTSLLFCIYVFTSSVRDNTNFLILKSYLFVVLDIFAKDNTYGCLL